MGVAYGMGENDYLREQSFAEDPLPSVEECLEIIQKTADWLISYPEECDPSARSDVRGIDMMPTLGRDLLKALEVVRERQGEDCRGEPIDELLDVAGKVERWLLDRFRQLSGRCNTSFAYWYFGAYTTMLGRSKDALEKEFGRKSPSSEFLRLAAKQRFGFLSVSLLADRRRHPAR